MHGLPWGRRRVPGLAGSRGRPGLSVVLGGDVIRIRPPRPRMAGEPDRDYYGAVQAYREMQLAKRRTAEHYEDSRDRYLQLEAKRIRK